MKAESEVGRGGESPEPAFLLLAFHDNPASQTSVTSIPNIIFFPNTASLAKILLACAAVVSVFLSQAGEETRKTERSKN